MRIWNGIEDFPEDFPPVVGSIGKCDGVHLGHQEIIRRSVADAATRRRPSLLISFDPHPVAVVAPERMPLLLQSRRQKLEALERTGLSDFLILRFDHELAALGGREFFDEVLLPRIEFDAFFVGDDFRFGHRRSGDLELLRRIGEERGFRVEGVPAVKVDGDPVSSSAIRSALARGEVERARRMLGRPYAVGGIVVAGQGRGRQLRYPTANLDLENELLPRNGVYVTETLALAGRYSSVTNVGVRPTFGGSVRSVETHLLEWEGDLYRERLEVRFLARIRDEIAFASVAELADQIARDRAAALACFANVGLQASPDR